MHHPFEWVQAAVNIIVALGLTRLVTAFVNLHSIRRSVRLDWIPVAWAANIFFLLLQFSWVFYTLREIVQQWTFGLFLGVLAFVMILFAAAALVLPTTERQAGDDLEEWFREHGRWALPFLVLYAVLSYIFNWYFGGSGPESNPASAITIILATTTFLVRSRRIQVATTILSLMLTVAIAFEMVRSG